MLGEVVLCNLFVSFCCVNRSEVNWPSWFAIVIVCNLCDCVCVELSVIIVSVI
jgi:hypothetical protein